MYVMYVCVYVCMYVCVYIESLIVGCTYSTCTSYYAYLGGWWPSRGEVRRDFGFRLCISLCSNHLLLEHPLGFGVQGLELLGESSFFVFVKAF